MKSPDFNSCLEKRGQFRIDLTTVKLIRERKLKRIWLALLLSIALDIVLVLIFSAVYSWAPESRVSEVLDQIGAPVERLVNWIAPGHSGVQPLLDMLFSAIFVWALTWIVLVLSSFLHRTKPEST